MRSRLGPWEIIGLAIDRLQLLKADLKIRLRGSRATPWDIISRARVMLLELEASKGIAIHEVQITGTFEKWDDGIGVWIFFPTDDDLREHSTSGVTGEIEQDFREILQQLKYPFRKFPRVTFVFDSDENVQKNYEGSYFYRLR
jgi:hypothetical protein